MESDFFLQGYSWLLARKGLQLLQPTMVLCCMGSPSTVISFIRSSGRLGMVTFARKQAIYKRLAHVMWLTCYIQVNDCILPIAVESKAPPTLKRRCSQEVAVAPPYPLMSSRGNTLLIFPFNCPAQPLFIPKGWAGFIVCELEVQSTGKMERSRPKEGERDNYVFYLHCGGGDVGVQK